MTRDQIQDVRDDIAYMRSLAEEGRKTPLLGGSILVMAGLIFSAAALTHGAAVAGVLTLGRAGVGWVWAAAFGLFAVGLVLLRARIGRLPGAWSPVNRAVGTAWMAAGQMIFVLALSILILTWRYESPAALALFPSLIFAAYGVGWAVAASMSDRKGLWLLAVGAWIAAPLIALLAGSAAQFLVYAAGLLLLTVPPGLMLMRAQPSAIV